MDKSKLRELDVVRIPADVALERKVTGIGTFVWYVYPSDIATVEAICNDENQDGLATVVFDIPVDELELRSGEVG